MNRAIRRLWGPVLLGLVLLAPPAVSSGKSEEPITVFLVRHAEKDTEDPDDPGLDQAGERRAAALDRLLARVGVTHLFSSQYRRTRHTLGPLAERTGLEIQVVRAQKPEEQLDALRRLPAGSVAVVAGHSNTVPELTCGLGGAVPDLDCSGSGRGFDQSEYDRLYLVILPTRGGTGTFQPRTLALRYGEGSD